MWWWYAHKIGDLSGEKIRKYKKIKEIKNYLKLEFH